jgi:hypothetical protein
LTVAQVPKNYWQQEVNYTITVTLNDSLNTLDGDIRIAYINHSPDTLQAIYMHLWPNGYKDNSTAFAQQMLENGNGAFYFSKDEDHGYIDSLNFKVNDKEVKWNYDEQHIDIAKLLLNTPLNHGDSIIITTPFHVKIPRTFSRLGYVGQSYQISQWYPKPAVFDAAGWHPLPYLDQGEFYSEFGSFNVAITLPQNYTVGATGDLQDENEKKRLDSLAALPIPKSRDMSFPVSSKKMKTLHYTQNNIHDFAWFADKRFNVAKSEVILKPLNKVTTWCFFLNDKTYLWNNAIHYADSAVSFYSRCCINYPYKQVSVVEGPIEAGDGMEYPNVCIIGTADGALELEETIVHEIGHNWFYGMLGSNERDDPWMDEGINSYYEYRYMQYAHPNLKIVSDDVSPGIAEFFDLEKYSYAYSNYLVYLLMASQHLDQPVNLTSTKFTPVNYDFIVYCKTALIFRYLAAYLGQSVFDSIMQKYNRDWQYKHPHPEDVKNEFENFSNKNLDWFFNDELQTTKQLDYKILSARDTEHIGNSVYRVIKVKNTGQIKAPFSISAIRHDSIIYTIWYGGVFGTINVLFPKFPCDAYKIDALYDMPDINEKNNTIYTWGFLRRDEPLRLQLLGSIDDPDRTQLFYLPLIGYNFYDKTMLGLMIYNHVLPTRKFEYTLAPFYAFGSRTFTGMARTDNYFYPKTIFQQIDFRLSAETFDYSLIPQPLRFQKYQAALFFKFKKKDARSSIDKELSFRVVNTYSEFPVYTSETEYSIYNFSNYYSEANFSIQNTRLIDPYYLNLQLQQGPDFSTQQYVKVIGHAGYRINYNKPKTYLDISASGGKFLISNLSNDGVYPYSFHLSANTGSEDYLYDNIFLGRSQSSGFLSQQAMPADNALKVITASNPGYGDSNNDFFMANIKTTLPFSSPFFLFVDIGTYGKLENSTYETVVYDAGIGFHIGNFIKIYYPFAFSSDLKSEIVLPNYQNPLERIVFTLNFTNPFDELRKIGF